MLVNIFMVIQGTKAYILARNRLKSVEFAMKIVAVFFAAAAGAASPAAIVLHTAASTDQASGTIKTDSASPWT